MDFYPIIWLDFVDAPPHGLHTDIRIVAVDATDGTAPKWPAIKANNCE